MKAIKTLIAILLSLNCMGLASCKATPKMDGIPNSGITSSQSQQQESSEESRTLFDENTSRQDETTSETDSQKSNNGNESASSNTESSQKGNSNTESSVIERSDAETSKKENSNTESSAQETGKTSENSKTGQNSKPAQSSKTESSQSNSQTSKPSQSSKTSEASKPSQSSQSSQNSQTSKPTEASKPTETSKPSQTSTPSTPSQPSKPTTVNVSSISLNKSSMTLTVGESSKLTATISPSNATNKSFSWVNSNTAVVSVDGNGNIKALKAGTASITAKTGNGKTAVCNVTVKAKEVSQPAKKKVTQIGDFGRIPNLSASTTPTTAHWGVKIYPKNADTTNLRISISDNLKKYVKIGNLKKDSTDYQTYDGYDFDVKIEKVTQDITGTYTVSCDGVSSTGTITLQCEYDSRYANYYPPFTKTKINAILQDMRKYGESLGSEWLDSLYFRWDYNEGKYYTNASFSFPHSANANNSHMVGKSLHDYLIEENFDATYRVDLAPYGASWADTYFKVDAWQDPNNMDEWDFYILMGCPD